MMEMHENGELAQVSSYAMSGILVHRRRICYAPLMKRYLLTHALRHSGTDASFGTTRSSRRPMLCASEQHAPSFGCT